MIKRIKDLNPSGLMASKEIKNHMEKTESNLIRGMSDILVLSIIKQAGENGEYGYQIIKDIEKQTNDTLVLEEGALYPLLRKLLRLNLLKTKQKTVHGRNRTYYSITQTGIQFYNRMAGFFIKITESLSSMLEVDINVNYDKYYYCPMCANKIDLAKISDSKFYVMCGHNVYEDLTTRRLKK